MSHLVVIETRVHDAAALTTACRRLGLAEPVHGSVRFFSGDATGLSVKLPGWQYPIVVDAAEDRKSTRLNSSHPSISYAVFCLKTKNGSRNTIIWMISKRDRHSLPFVEKPH